MGVLNVTPDSFSDGGLFLDPSAAVDHAQTLVAKGADVIDVGGESTRPGAAPVSAENELERVVPVIEAIAAQISVPISVDTSKPEVITAAVAAGAGMINDVRALRLPGALEAAAAAGVPVCLMHMQGTPASMQQKPAYADVIEEVSAFLSERVSACVAGGIPRDRILLDPGFGFGKTMEHNLALLAGIERLCEPGLPVLVGISRKSMIGSLTGREVRDRLAGSLAAAVLAVERGARVVRVHDPAETRDALRVAWAVRGAERWIRRF
jgi:dihydropteroate synthase